MNTSCEVEGAAYEPENDAGNQWKRRSTNASESDTPCACATDFPILSPHEIATLILIAHTPGQVSTGWPDLQPLLNGDLVQVDRCDMCRGSPHVTALGEKLVVRLDKASPGKTSRAPNSVRRSAS
jgi:hypothetical protein